MTIIEAKQIRLVDYLLRLGFKAQVEKGFQHWYLSPLHEERTPSFKIDDRKNLWFDFGLAKGGTIIEFAKELYNVSDLSEVLAKIADCSDIGNIRRVIPNASNVPMEQQYGDIKIRTLNSYPLCSYLSSRKVDVGIARIFCCEIHYTLRNKSYFALGFQNDSIGYEIRNQYFKGNLKGKDITTIHYKQENCPKRAIVHEGFMDFLSYMTLEQKDDKEICLSHVADHIIMNSVSQLKKTLQVLEHYDYIHCYLDNDLAGKKTTETIAGLYANHVIDESYRYKGYKDLNDYIRGKRL